MRLLSSAAPQHVDLSLPSWSRGLFGALLQTNRGLAVHEGSALTVARESSRIDGPGRRSLKSWLRSAAALQLQAPAQPSKLAERRAISEPRAGTHRALREEVKALELASLPLSLRASVRAAVDGLLNGERTHSSLERKRARDDRGQRRAGSLREALLAVHLPHEGTAGAR